MDAPVLDGLIDRLPFSVSIEWDESGDLVIDPATSLAWWGSLTGLSIEQALNWGWLDAVHPDDRAATRLAWERAVSRGESYIAVYRVRTAGGDWHSIFAHGVPQRADDGSVTGWSGSLIDITAYRRATQQATSISSLISALGKASTTSDILQVVLDTLKTTMNADAGAVMLLSPDGQALEVAASFGVEPEIFAEWQTFSATGPYPSAEVIGTRDAVWIERPSEWRDRWPDSVELFEGHGYCAVASIPLAEGDTLLGALSLNFRRETHFSPSDREFLVSVGLQTARALQLTRLVDAERRARESAEFASGQLRLVTNALPALIGYIDADFRYQFNNAAYRDWFKQEQDIPPGTPVVEVIGAEAFYVLLPHFQKALGGELVVIETELTYRGAGKRDISASYVPDFAADGTVRGFAVLVLDISDRKRAEERAARVLEFTTSLTQATTQDEVVAVVTRLGRATVQAAATAVFLFDDEETLMWTSTAEHSDVEGAQSLTSVDPLIDLLVRDQRTLVLQPGHPLLTLSPILKSLFRDALPNRVVVVRIQGQTRMRGGLIFALTTGINGPAPDLSLKTLLADLAGGAIDRARLYDSLQESEARFRHLADALPQIVWVSSGDGSSLEYLNQRWTDYTGFRTEDTRSGQTSKLVHPGDRDIERESWRNSLRTGSPFEAEVRLLGDHGRYRWFLSRAVPVRDPNGDVISWFGTMTDIDEQRRAMAHQRFISHLDSVIRLMSDPQQIMQTLVATVGDHLSVDRSLLTEVAWDRPPLDQQQDSHDPVSRVPSIELKSFWESREVVHQPNLPEMTTLIGTHLGEELRYGRIVSVADVHNDELTAEIATELKKFEIASLMVIPYLRAGRWVASLSVHAAVPHVWSNDEVVMAEAAVKRVWPVIERSRAVEALRQSENRLRHAALAADFGDFDFTVSTGEGYWSRDVLRVFRRESGELTLTHLTGFLEMIHPDDRDRIREALDAAADPEGDGDLNAEFRHITSSGEVCWILMRGGVEFIGTGSERAAARISGIVMDITDRKRAEEERLAFVDAAAHDLKNPVASIRAFAQIGQRLQARQSLEPERLSEILNSVEHATDQLTGVIQDLLDAAHLRAGIPLALRPERVDLISLVESRVAELQKAPAGHVIRYMPELERLEGCWDTARLQRVFDNLLTNAVKFTPEGGTIEIGVFLATDEDGDHAVVTVVDTGIGIAAADLPRMFDWYQRGSNVPASIGGTGIGLAGARKIVEHHGGSIEITSVEHEGTTVVVRLPLTTNGGCPPVDPDDNP